MQHNPQFLALVAEAKKEIQECSVFDIKNMLDNNSLDGLLIDVREESEYARDHFPGATHLSRGVIEVKIENLIPNKDQKMYLYCGGGYRSALSAQNLQKMGYRNVISVDGGYRAWTSNNFELVSEE
ncbi:rhodanese-like domain-containing protein [Fangia hongkongensis]|uniref:rhodanese-like domain-containing protein n=1 Tax=Fangia hongkongensis TaxID=270495 RepID=UPI0003724024|nr:rhodanese-like domain-containing protein [Fangia hongkongensis]MBK2125866.1 sulfurtransferase [Fangia hongkongensis]